MDSGEVAVFNKMALFWVLGGLENFLNIYWSMLAYVHTPYKKINDQDLSSAYRTYLTTAQKRDRFARAQNYALAKKNLLQALEVYQQQIGNIHYIPVIPFNLYTKIGPVSYFRFLQRNINTKKTVIKKAIVQKDRVDDLLK